MYFFQQIDDYGERLRQLPVVKIAWDVIARAHRKKSVESGNEWKSCLARPSFTVSGESETISEKKNNKEEEEENGHRNRLIEKIIPFPRETKIADCCATCRKEIIALVFHKRRSVQ